MLKIILYNVKFKGTMTKWPVLNNNDFQYGNRITTRNTCC